MKNLKLEKTGTWVETKLISMTEEQKILFYSKDESLKADKLAMMKQVSADANVPATAEDIAIVQPILDANITEGEFVFCGIMMAEDKISGTIHYRVEEKIETKSFSVPIV